MKKNILNLVIYQIGWLVCVIGGSVYAVAYTCLALLIHYRYIWEQKSEWHFISLLGLSGCLWDILIVKSGIIEYGNPWLLGIPIWLICLWLLFATTFLHCLYWLNQYLRIAALCSAIFGPTTYWLGMRFTDAMFTTALPVSLMIMALGWSLLFPTGLYIARRYKD